MYAILDPSTPGTFQLPPAIRAPDEPATEFVYRYVKHLIITLQLEPGAMITETMVANATHLSRTPARESLLRLASESLVELAPRRGAIVSAVTLRQIRELAETRSIIESFAAREICQKNLPIDALTRWVEAQSVETEKTEPDEFHVLDADRAFHQSMIAAVGNTELSNVYKSFGDRQIRVGIALFRAQPARLHSSVIQHQRIVDALMERDADQAVALINTHLFGFLNGLEAAFTS